MLEIAVYGIVLFLISNMYGGMRLGYLKNSEIDGDRTVYKTEYENLYPNAAPRR